MLTLNLIQAVNSNKLIAKPPHKLIPHILTNPVQPLPETPRSLDPVLLQHLTYLGQDLPPELPRLTPCPGPRNNLLDTLDILPYFVELGTAPVPVLPSRRHTVPTELSPGATRELVYPVIHLREH